MCTSKRVAIVTGGVKGIGRAITEALLLDGISVLATYYETEETVAPTIQKLREVAQKNGVRLESLRFDMSKIAEIETVFDYCEQILGTANVFVANAGAHIPPKPIVEYTESDFDFLCNTNFKGNFFCIKECAKRLADEGHVIIISSSTVKNPVPRLGLYSSIKAALEMLVKTLVMELADRKIRINAIAPGVTATNNAEDGLGETFFEEVKRTTPLHRVGTPEDIGKTVRMLCSDDAEWLNGQILIANGGGKY